jgi:hypothetical protein
MKFWTFFYFCGSFLPSWIRIRIQQLKLMRIHADPDPDPKPWFSMLAKINAWNKGEQAFFFPWNWLFPVSMVVVKGRLRLK